MLHHWILSKARCNYRICYSTYPPRNSPEYMPLNCNLFKDWNNRVDCCVFLTFYLLDNNSKKFSLSTPNMVRVWEGIPVSKQII